MAALFGLVQTASLAADAGEALTPNNQATEPLDNADTNSMVWPMLPGESVNDVARLFYPKNQYMQRQFVFKTLRLSKSALPNLNANDRFTSPTLLVTPTLKSLSYHAKAIKPARSTPKNTRLKMSYTLVQIPAKLMQDYQYLLNRNEFLKVQLAKLNEKLILLQAKLNALKLMLDKSLSLPTTQPAKQQVASKVVKNKSLAPIAPSAKATTTIVNAPNRDQWLVLLGLVLVASVSWIFLKKPKQKIELSSSFYVTSGQAEAVDTNGAWPMTNSPSMPVNVFDTKPEKPAEESHQNNLTRLDSTLEEAKLLMSINRSGDAIAHLKMTIESQPKASINHWLYLLEVFRKLSLKEDFENYAKELHSTFNVMPPVWQDTIVPMVVSQSLEEFPHIADKLCKLWPNDAAYAYLCGLITDNRGGERTGFGKQVLDEILLLIALLDTRKEIH